MNAVAKDITVAAQQEVAPVQQVGESAAILSMIERASRDPSVDIEKFERLMAMRERMDDRAAKQSFDNAVSQAKGEIGPIAKNKVVDFTSQKGRTNYRHEDFAEVARAVDPVLNRYGLSYRFRSQQKAGKVSITCILSHRDGYAEETTLEANEDSSGNKNSIQAIGSSATYLQRYTLKLALGLSASDQDDDGKAAGAPSYASESQIEELQGLLISTGRDVPKFLAYFKIENLDEFPAKRFDEAVTLLTRKTGGAK